MTTGDSKKTERLREEKQKKRFAAGTPYDDAFRRMTVEIPCAAILFLRSNTNTPDKLEIEMITPGGTVSFDIPSMKLASYNLGSIFEKELYFLIPFFLFNREKTFAVCETDQAKLKELLEEVSNIRVSA